MKAIQVKQPGGPEAMELAELPVPQPKANEAVVKLAASGVNFIDVYFREGRYKAPMPFVLGQEGAGVTARALTIAPDKKLSARVRELVRRLAWFGLAEIEYLLDDRGVPRGRHEASAANDAAERHGARQRGSRGGCVLLGAPQRHEARDGARDDDDGQLRLLVAF